MTSSGGTYPQFSADDRELYFLSGGGDGRLLVARRIVRAGERPCALLVENRPLLLKGVAKP